MAAATLSIDLEARLAKLQEGMDKATRLSDKAAAQIEAKWSTLSELGRGFGTALVAAFSVGTIAAFTRATVNALDALNDAADATGATVENLSALEDVARRNGGTLDDVAGTLVKFNAGLKDADGKNGVSQALQAIGLNAAELKKLDPAEALRQVAVALSGFADDGNKARIVQELFGKSVREAAPFLKDLAEQTTLVGTVTSETAKSAEKLNKQLFAMQTDLQNAGRAIASELLPQMEILSEYAKSSAGDVGLLDLALGGIRNTFQTVAVLGANVAFVIKALGREVGGIAAQMVALGRGDFTGFTAIADALREDGERARKELDEFERRIFGGSARNENYGNEGRGTKPPKIGGAGGGSGGAGGGAKPPALGAIRDAKGQYKSDFLRSESASFGKLEEEAKVSFGAILDAQEQYKSDFLRSEKETYDQLGPVLAKSADEIDEYTKRGQQRIQDSLGDGLYAALSGNFDDIGTAFGNLIKRMIAESLAADITAKLFGGAKGGTQGSLLSSVIGFFAGGRAGGGPTSPGKMYEVNEQGTPELLEYGGREFLLSGKRSGYVRPLTAGGGGAGAGGWVSADTYNIGQGVSAGQVAAAIKAANGALEARIYRRMREGGPA